MTKGVPIRGPLIFCELHGSPATLARRDFEGTDLGKREFHRQNALRRPCPKCGAGVGEPCVGSRRSRQPRKSPHIQRYRPTEAAAPWQHRRAWRVAEQGGAMGEGNKLPGLYPWLRFK